MELCLVDVVPKQATICVYCIMETEQQHLVSRLRVLLGGSCGLQLQTQAALSHVP